MEMEMEILFLISHFGGEATQPQQATQTHDFLEPLPQELILLQEIYGYPMMIIYQAMPKI
jgi:hypothetical protein